jgi:hypothetical protein
MAYVTNAGNGDSSPTSVRSDLHEYANGPENSAATYAAIIGSRGELFRAQARGSAG